MGQVFGIRRRNCRYPMMKHLSKWYLEVRQGNLAGPSWEYELGCDGHRINPLGANFKNLVYTPIDKVSQ